MKYIGAHFSIEKGFTELVNNAKKFNANAFALFTKPSLQWKGSIITEDTSNEFLNACLNDYPNNSILAHASYMINMGNPDKDKREKSKNAFIDEMKRCKQLGIKYLNFHPGSYCSGDLNKSIKYIGLCIKEAIESVPDVIPVIETMAGAGTNIGARFEHIRDIINECGYFNNIGVCIDTCHSFTAGYDIRTPELYNNFMNEFNQIIGLEYLKGMHLNDSKHEFGSHKDRHEQIGDGFIGITAFQSIIEDKRTDEIPLILETRNSNKWKDEIALLRSFTSK